MFLTSMIHFILKTAAEGQSDKSITASCQLSNHFPFYSLNVILINSSKTLKPPPISMNYLICIMSMLVLLVYK